MCVYNNYKSELFKFGVKSGTFDGFIKWVLICGYEWFWGFAE
jgi:hypothetical protein